MYTKLSPAKKHAGFIHDWTRELYAKMFGPLLTFSCVCSTTLAEPTGLNSVYLLLSALASATKPVYCIAVPSQLGTNILDK